MKTIQADLDFKRGVRWAEEAREHGHPPEYYNDSECAGCAEFRRSDPALASWAHRYANLLPRSEP